MEKHFKMSNVVVKYAKKLSDHEKKMTEEKDVSIFPSF